MKRILAVFIAALVLITCPATASAVSFGGEEYKEVSTFDQFQEEAVRQFIAGNNNIRLAMKKPSTETRSSFERMLVLLDQIPINIYSYDASTTDVGGYFKINFKKKGSSAINTRNISAESKIKSTMASLKLSGKSEYAKVYQIYTWITKNIKYDDNYTCGSATEAILYKKAYCEGYAKLMKRMCVAANVNCKVITSGAHAWNIVKIGGKWYYCDTCWDAEVPCTSWRYFLVGSKFPHKAKAIHRIGDYKIQNDYPYPVTVNSTWYTVKSKNRTKFVLRWKKANNVTGYQIRYKVKGAKTWKYKTWGQKTTGWTITGLKSGVAYQATIRAYKKLFNKTYYSKWR